MENANQFGPNAMTYNGGSYKYSIPDVVQKERQAKSYSNTNPDLVIERDDWGFYNGALVIKVPALLDNGLSYGVIFLGNECNVNTLKHEYGHYLHLQQIGFVSYTANVAIPSFIGSKVSHNLGLSSKSYYSQPWEYIADVLGEPERFLVIGLIRRLTLRLTGYLLEL